MLAASCEFVCMQPIVIRYFGMRSFGDGDNVLDIPVYELSAIMRYISLYVSQLAA